MNAGITYNESYAELDALIAAGANISDIERWVNGDISPKVIGYLRVWHLSSSLIKAHVEEASADASKRKAKKKR